MKAKVMVKLANIQSPLSVLLKHLFFIKLEAT